MAGSLRRFVPLDGFSAPIFQRAQVELQKCIDLIVAQLGTSEKVTFKFTRTIIKVSGTYLTPKNCFAMIREARGGGAGGGACASAASGKQSCASGGSAGGWASDLIVNPAAQYTVVIGAPGLGGAAGANPGNPGGDTSFGTLLAKGGGPGQAGVDSSTGSVLGGGQVSTGGVGDWVGGGEQGGFGIQVPGSSGIFAQSGAGGNSDVGLGGLSVGGYSFAGNNGQGNSSGGSGATSFNAGGAFKGGDGTAGLAWALEFST